MLFTKLPQLLNKNSSSPIHFDLNYPSTIQFCSSLPRMMIVLTTKEARKFWMMGVITLLNAAVRPV
jgi:hypothetical protein